MLYRAINGDSAAGPERREDPGAPAPAPARYEVFNSYKYISLFIY